MELNSLDILCVGINNSYLSCRLMCNILLYEKCVVVI
jgi:hypothetical protein